MTDQEVAVPDGTGVQLFTGSPSFVPQLNEEMPLEVRKTTIRDASRQFVAVDDKLQIAQGELLWEINENGYWREWTHDEIPYETFNEYVDLELSMASRKARYLISIYAKFVVDLGLPMEVLAGLEWSKAKELVAIITEENWQDLLEQAKDMSVSEIKAMVKEMRSDGETDTVERETFVLHADQAQTLREAMAAAASIAPSEHKSVHLDMISTAFLALNVGEDENGAVMHLSHILRHIERAYGITLEVKAISEDYITAFDAGKEPDNDDQN